MLVHRCCCLCIGEGGENRESIASLREVQLKRTASQERGGQHNTTKSTRHEKRLFCVAPHATLLASDGVTRLTSGVTLFSRSTEASASASMVLLGSTKPTKRLEWTRKARSRPWKQSTLCSKCILDKCFSLSKDRCASCTRQVQARVKNNTGRMGRAFFENTHTHALYIRATHRWNERCFVSHGPPCFVVLI